MSENKIPEIVYLNVPNAAFLENINTTGADVFCMTTDEQMTEYSIPYILKSKYDEQAAEIEKLKAELEKVKKELESEWDEQAGESL